MDRGQGASGKHSRYTYSNLAKAAAGGKKQLVFERFPVRFGALELAEMRLEARGADSLDQSDANRIDEAKNAGLRRRRILNQKIGVR